MLIIGFNVWLNVNMKMGSCEVVCFVRLVYGWCLVCGMNLYV